MRTLLLTIHILCAGGWFGANIAQALAANAFKSASADARVAWANVALSLSRVFYNVVGVGVLITGIGLLVAVDSPYSFSDPFVSIGFLAVIIGAALGMAVFAPTARAWASALGSGDTTGAAAAEAKITTFGIIDSAVIVLTVAAMVAKLGV